MRSFGRGTVRLYTASCWRRAANTGTYYEIKRREFYVKPSARARVKRLWSRRRVQKAAVRRARRDRWEQAHEK